MIQYSIVTEQPDSEPVSLAEAKTHLEYAGTAKDNYITGLIKTARQLCESYTGLSFVTKERETKLDRFPCKLYICRPIFSTEACLKPYGLSFCRLRKLTYLLICDIPHHPS